MPRYKIFHRNNSGTLFIKPSGSVSKRRSDELNLGGEVDVSPAARDEEAAAPSQSAQQEQLRSPPLPLSEDQLAKMAQARLEQFMKLEKYATKFGVKFDGLAAFKSGVAIDTARHKVMSDVADEDDRTAISNVSGFQSVADSVAAERGGAGSWERTIQEGYAKRGLEAPKPGEKVTARQLVRRVVGGAAHPAKINTHQKD